MLSVFLARPDQLHRRRRHRLADPDGLFDEVALVRQATAEAAADQLVVDRDRIGVEAGDLGGETARIQRVLRAGPDVAAAIRDAYRGAERFQGRVVQERHAVLGRDALRRGGPKFGGVAALEVLPDLGTLPSDFDVALEPGGPGEALALPPSVNTGSSAARPCCACQVDSATTATAFDSRTSLRMPGVTRRRLLIDAIDCSVPPNTGAVRTAACSMPGDAHVDGVDRAAVGLAGQVEAAARGADDA